MLFDEYLTQLSTERQDDLLYHLDQFQFWLKEMKSAIDDFEQAHRKVTQNLKDLKGLYDKAI